MFVLKALACRAFQIAFRLVLPVLPYREPKILPSCTDLPQLLQKKGIRSVCIVTDRGIVTHGLSQPLETVLRQNGIDYIVYADTQPNPTVENVEQARRLYLEHRCEGLIAIGGGSAMDCAKALGARIVYPRKTVGQMKGILRVRRRLPLLVAIPTTAGTGSEATLAAVITDPACHAKYALMSFPLIPHYAVLDPVLTESLPPHLTAATGMDALTHAIEAYIGRSTTKETRRLALNACRLVFANLETAYADGHCRPAREGMLHAANQAGVAFSKSYVGYVHALAHALGGRYGTPHGLANAVILPYVLEAYGKSAEKKLCRLAVAAGVADPADRPADAATALIAAIRAMNARMQIPATLPEIRPEDVPSLAAHAEQEANPLYPVPKLMTKAELAALYTQIAGRGSGDDQERLG